MKKKHSLFLHGFILILTMLGCSKADLEVLEPKPSQESGLQSLYESLVNLPPASLLSARASESRGGSYATTYPVFTPEDLKYLSSLSQRQFMELRDSLIICIGGLEKLDSIQAGNYADAFNALGGHEGMDQLLSFSTAYLDTIPGWESIQALMPNKLSETVIKRYVYQAAFIDQFSRPIYEELVQMEVENSYEIVRGLDQSLCRQKLAIDLSIAGINMGVDAFLDAMTGGVLSVSLLPEEADLLALELEGLNIWLDYEVCNKRWH